MRFIEDEHEGYETRENVLPETGAPVPHGREAGRYLFTFSCFSESAY